MTSRGRDESASDAAAACPGEKEPGRRPQTRPAELPRIDGVDLGVAYQSMAGDAGGDFYDAFPMARNSWGIAVGDACGKGPAAADAATRARHAVRRAARIDPNPSHILTRLNRVLAARQEGDGTFLTAAFARVDIGPHGVRLHAAIAGHPPAIVLRADGAIERHGPTGRLLGFFDHVDISDALVYLDPGDTCVLFTDGATDVRRDHDIFGDVRLTEVVAGCRGMNAHAIAACIHRAVADFQDGEIEDDLAVVVITVPPLLKHPAISKFMMTRYSTGDERALNRSELKHWRLCARRLYEVNSHIFEDEADALVALGVQAQRPDWAGGERCPQLAWEPPGRM